MGLDTNNAAGRVLLRCMAQMLAGMQTATPQAGQQAELQRLQQINSVLKKMLGGTASPTTCNNHVAAAAAVSPTAGPFDHQDTQPVLHQQAQTTSTQLTPTVHNNTVMSPGHRNNTCPDLSSPLSHPSHDGHDGHVPPNAAFVEPTALHTMQLAVASPGTATAGAVAPGEPAKMQQSSIRGKVTQAPALFADLSAAVRTAAVHNHMAGSAGAAVHHPSAGLMMHSVAGAPGALDYHRLIHNSTVAHSSTSPFYICQQQQTLHAGGPETLQAGSPENHADAIMLFAAPPLKKFKAMQLQAEPAELATAEAAAQAAALFRGAGIPHSAAHWQQLGVPQYDSRSTSRQQLEAQRGEVEAVEGLMLLMNCAPNSHAFQPGASAPPAAGDGHGGLSHIPQRDEVLAAAEPVTQTEQGLESAQKMEGKHFWREIEQRISPETQAALRAAWAAKQQITVQCSHKDRAPLTGILTYDAAEQEFRVQVPERGGVRCKPCDFEALAGKPGSDNWQMSIKLPGYFMQPSQQQQRQRQFGSPSAVTGTTNAGAANGGSQAEHPRPNAVQSFRQLGSFNCRKRQKTQQVTKQQQQQQVATEWQQPAPKLRLVQLGHFARIVGIDTSHKQKQRAHR